MKAMIPYGRQIISMQDFEAVAHGLHLGKQVQLPKIVHLAYFTGQLCGNHRIHQFSWYYASIQAANSMFSEEQAG